MKLRLVIFLVSVLLSSGAYSLEILSGRVTMLEPTYMPGSIILKMDSGNATCPAGALLRWQNPDSENNKTVYSTLMGAMISGTQILFHINDGDSSCYGTHIHLVNS